MTRILVVDDDRSVAYSIGTLLEYEGFEVAIAEDGLAGLAAIEADKFDVVILDIFMPGMGGLETIEAMHRRQPGLPIIAISGFMLRDSVRQVTDDLAKAIELGAAFSLNKPFRRRDVLAAVSACLDGAAARPSNEAA